MDSLTASQVLCSICQERLIDEGGREVEVVGTPCGHVYHKACLAAWFQKNEPQRRLIRDNPEELMRGECPICFKPQWLKRCIRIYLSCDDADTTQVRALFDQMENELKNAKQEIAESKQQVADAKKQVAESKLELTKATELLKEQAALLDKATKKTTKKASVEINNNCRKKTASTSVINTSAAPTSTSVLATTTKTTSTSRSTVAIAAATSKSARVTSKAKADAAATKLLPTVVKLRQHAKQVARLSTDSVASSASGSVYSPPRGVKAPIVRQAIMTRARARNSSGAAPASSVSGLNASGTIAPRSQRVRTAVAGNPFSLHR